MQRGSLLYDVFVLHQAVGTMLTEGLAGAPLTPSEYAVYSFFYEYPGSTPTQMSQNLGMPMQTASDWLATLRRRRHIRTVKSADDGRSYTVHLTPSGITAHRATNRAFERVNQRFVAALFQPEEKFRAEVAEMIDATQSVRKARGVASR